MTGLDSSNNTVISLAACSTCNWGVGFYVALGGIADHISVRNNFIDATGINRFTASPWFGNGKTPAAATSSFSPISLHWESQNESSWSSGDRCGRFGDRVDDVSAVGRRVPVPVGNAGLAVIRRTQPVSVPSRARPRSR